MSVTQAGRLTPNCPQRLLALPTVFPSLLSLGRQRVPNCASRGSGCVCGEEEEVPGQGKEEEMMSQRASLVGVLQVIAVLGGSHRVILSFGTGL